MDTFIHFGYVGLFLSSFLASTIVPLSADVVLTALVLLKFNPWVCLIIATGGNFLGGLTSYGLGYIGKWEWLEKYFKVDRQKVENFQKKITQYGIFAAAFAWLPFVGDLIAISLGFFKIRPTWVFILMLTGRFLRFFVIILVTLYFI
ncbi:MAG: VTT domain-containing protein [Bacteroidales bacterium]|mgnify:FL=1|jgi:membrane protein YqaA with SNARE-associated domain|nr:VTT domain-containing protein [Bacteroidales bacterium]MDD2687972.1 VTT domain-containing protein [Bacteroidales bacterium]MDD3329809.1 VTT domain-containing protein [Bacteroidales bacterium]MDD3690580.1 VTT domain-containing protein [Bacteroidales bacterium]MDD4044054.1 VTT domain-containing protein [Bacteroidales bacterium]